MTSSPIHYHPLHRDWFHPTMTDHYPAYAPPHIPFYGPAIQPTTAIGRFSTKRSAPESSTTSSGIPPKTRAYCEPIRSPTEPTTNVIASYKSSMFNPDLYVAVISKMFASDGSILCQGPALTRSDLQQITQSLSQRYRTFIKSNQMFARFTEGDMGVLLRQNVPFFIQLIMAKVHTSNSRFEQLCHLVGSDGNVSKFPELAAMSFEYFCSSTEFLRNNVHYERQYLLSMIRLTKLNLFKQNLALLANLIPFYMYKSTGISARARSRSAFFEALNLIQAETREPIVLEEVDEFFGTLDDMHIIFPTN